MLQVEIHREGRAPEILIFEEMPVGFGASPENELVLEGPELSLFEGELRPAPGGGVELRPRGARSRLRIRGADGTEEPAYAGRRLSPRDRVLLPGIELRVEAKEEAAAEAPPTTQHTVPARARFAETRLARASELRRELESDSRRLGLLLDLARDLNSLHSLEAVLARIARTVFDSLPQATHFAICQRRQDGDFAVRFASHRDGSRLPPDAFSVSQSILRRAVDRRSALLFSLLDAAGSPTASVIANAIASALAVPLMGERGELGALLIDNRSSLEPFERQDLDFALVLAQSATAALERAQFQADIERMFEGFVDASVAAIESRDPSTSGHSRRVARLSVCLAEAVRQHGGLGAPVRELDTGACVELAYAALLHDFGKVGVRECVLQKAEKLFPEQLERVLSRLEFAAAVARAEVFERALGEVAAGRVSPEAARSEAEEKLAGLRRDLFTAQELVRTVSRQSGIDGVQRRALEALARRVFVRPWALQPERLLRDEELASLFVERGTLTPEQRAEIEAHVQHGYRVLAQIPWPEALRSVPELVELHHEKLDGSGYPEHRTAEQIPLRARILTVCDIFDAVTAADRPYRSALSRESGLALLRSQAAAGQLDERLVALFAEERIFERRVADVRLRSLLG